MFQTNEGPSFIAHQFLFSGTSAPEGYNTSDTYYKLFAVENPTSPEHEFPQEAGCYSVTGTEAEDVDSTSSSGAEGYTYNSGYPCYNHTSLADLLDNASPLPISWAYYNQSSSSLNTIWNAPNALSAICPLNVGGTSCGSGGNGDWQYVQSSPGEVIWDIKNCDLPSVSWVIPDGYWSDHPGWINGTRSYADGGPSWVAAIVNAVGLLPKGCDSQVVDFNNTVVIVTWDDWGGWFDHVQPYNHNSTTLEPGGYPYPPSSAPDDGVWNTYGFRVPLLVISPYTPAHYVSGDMRNGIAQQPYVHDFGSILGFIEHAFSLDTASGFCGIAGALDLTNGCKYPFADHFAPDGPYECVQTGNCGSYGTYPLSDFFTLTSPRGFTAIPTTSMKYQESCFDGTLTQIEACFPHYPSDPDNDGVDTQD